jgi:hypothetical protein
MLLVLHHLKQCSSVTVPRTLLFDAVDLLPTVYSTDFASLKRAC